MSSPELKAADKTSDLRTVPIGDLRESKTNPRKSFNAAAMAELVQSVKQSGVINPILCRQVGSNGTLEIVAGARRYRAAKEAGLKQVPVTVRVMGDEEVLALQLVENLQREDLDPIDIARGLRALIAEAKLTVQQAATRTGRSVADVYAWLKLMDLESHASDCLRQGKISVNHAVLISRLPVDGQKAALQQALRGESVKDLGDYIRQELNQDLAAAPWKLDDATVLPKAGACMACPKRSQKDTHPDLKPDTCLDRDCYIAKLRAHNERRIKELTKDGTKVIRIWLGHIDRDDQKEHALPENAGDWKIVRGKRCKNVVKGFIVGTNSRGVMNNGQGGRVGTIVDICRTNTCKTHYASWERPYGEPKKPPSAAQRARVLQKAKKERELLAIRKTIYRLAIDKAAEKKEFDAKIWRMIAERTFERLYGNYKRLLYTALGWEPKKHKGYFGYDWDGPACERMNKMDAAGLRRFILQCVLVGETDGPSWNAKGDPLVEFGKNHGVTLATAKKEILQERVLQEKLVAAHKAKIAAEKKAALKKHQKRG